jgi:hypothetical protein
MAKVLDLKPTQVYVGMKSVAVKTHFFENASDEERHEYLRKNPVPIIKGPNSEFYMIDHHHLSRSLFESEHSKLYIKIIFDWSDLSVPEFWEKMEKNGFAYLLNKEGHKIPYTVVPSNVTSLEDDIFRSLAYFAREKGAFEKSTIPFAEFKWAAYYRKFLTEEDLKEHWHRSLKKAIELSLDKDAAHLPGYVGKYTCQGLF